MSIHKSNSNDSDNELIAELSIKLGSIDYDFSRFTIDDFTQWIASKRGIAIYLESSDALKRPLGFWVMSEDGAHVRYSGQLQGMLKIITILHELVHIYLGHKTAFIPQLWLPLSQFHPGFAARDPLEQTREDKEAEIGAIMLFQCIEHTNGVSQDDRQRPNLSDLFNKVTDI